MNYYGPKIVLFPDNEVVRRMCSPNGFKRFYEPGKSGMNTTGKTPRCWRLKHVRWRIVILLKPNKNRYFSGKHTGLAKNRYDDTPPAPQAMRGAWSPSSDGFRGGVACLQVWVQECHTIINHGITLINNSQPLLTTISLYKIGAICIHMYCNIKVSFLECHPPHIDEYWMY